MRVHALYSKDGSCKDIVVVPKHGRPLVMSEQNETALATWLIMCTRRDHSITKRVATQAAKALLATQGKHTLHAHTVSHTNTLCMSQWVCIYVHVCACVFHCVCVLGRNITLQGGAQMVGQIQSKTSRDHIRQSAEWLETTSSHHSGSADCVLCRSAQMLSGH